MTITNNHNNKNNNNCVLNDDDNLAMIILIVIMIIVVPMIIRIHLCGPTWALPRKTRLAGHQTRPQGRAAKQTNQKGNGALHTVLWTYSRLQEVGKHSIAWYRVWYTVISYGIV